MAFDRKVMKKGGAVTFEKGQLIQVYWNNLAGWVDNEEEDMEIDQEEGEFVGEESGW